jgi:hypothetical protein
LFRQYSVNFIFLITFGLRWLLSRSRWGFLAYRTLAEARQYRQLRDPSPNDMTDTAAPVPRPRHRPSRSTATISRRLPGRRSPVTQHQARHLVQLVRLLEREALQHFRVPVASRLPRDRFGEFFKLEAYRIFIEGAYACGFVCSDLKPESPLETERDRPVEAIARWSFPVIRQYVHYLVRHERWADGYSSPIFESLADGHLQQVVDRLEKDDSLYEPA